MKCLCLLFPLNSQSRVRTKLVSATVLADITASIGNKLQAEQLCHFLNNCVGCIQAVSVTIATNIIG